VRHPSQVYEAIWLLLGALLLAGLVVGLKSRPTRQGALFVLALAAFLGGRVLVGFSWRDEQALGPLNTEQLLALATLVALAAALSGVALVHLWRGRRRRTAEIVRMERPPSA
jgi:prolipoprotein diacylglyceryltransferase